MFCSVKLWSLTLALLHARCSPCLSDLAIASTPPLCQPTFSNAFEVDLALCELRLPFITHSHPPFFRSVPGTRKSEVSLPTWHLAQPSERPPALVKGLWTSPTSRGTSVPAQRPTPAACPGPAVPVRLRRNRTNGGS